MTRRCKCGCGEALPPASKSVTVPHKKKFHSFECMSRYAEEHLQAERERLRQGLDCYVKRVQKQEQKKKEREARQKKAKHRDNDVSRQLKLTQNVFNRMIKLERYKELLDAGEIPQCISCSKVAKVYVLGEFCCGHLKTVGAHEELRFNTLNVEFQCNRYCNKGLSGNLSGNKNTQGYLEGLKSRRGEAEFDRRMKYLERNHPNFTRDAKQLKVVRRWCAARTRQLEKELCID